MFKKLWKLNFAKEFHCKFVNIYYWFGRIRLYIWQNCVNCVNIICYYYFNLKKGVNRTEFYINYIFISSPRWLVRNLFTPWCVGQPLCPPRRPTLCPHSQSGGQKFGLQISAVSACYFYLIYNLYTVICYFHLACQVGKSFVNK